MLPLILDHVDKRNILVVRELVSINLTVVELLGLILAGHAVRHAVVELQLAAGYHEIAALGKVPHSARFHALG